MAEDWAEKTARQLLGRYPIDKGTVLILGGSDTGKTTLAAALAKQAAANQTVALVDSDIGQSHIGPPTTVGWAVVDNSTPNLSDLVVQGIGFVGHVTPVGHLLQLTAAITQCVRQARTAAQLVVIDTPGFISGPPAEALWWTVQRILQPELIIAVHCANELTHILHGLRLLAPSIELLQSPPQVKPKSPPHRREFRLSRFTRYFQDACLHNINLSNVAIQPSRAFRAETLVNQLVGLRGADGMDLAIGLIENWQPDSNIAVVRAPGMDIRQVRCLVIGDVSIDIAHPSQMVEPGN
ncbi:MAG: Clp1/GlmU family protein [Planctomycetota bacterium]|jgi:polynucleotide 5'-hydroxyl-kinase GRC3/NOL9